MTTARGVIARLTVTLLLVTGAFALGGGAAHGAPAGGAASSASGGNAAKPNKPSVQVDRQRASEGSTVTVAGSDWPADALVTLLLCGQKAVNGTADCANADSRTVTTSDQGTFSKQLPVAEPPVPCPCVIKAVAVTGEHAATQTKFTVAGHPVRKLPKEVEGAERLAVLDAKLEGSSGPLNWFGAPTERQLVLTVTNQGAGTARNPVFEVGTAQGVFAHDWVEQRWRDTLEPGEQKTVALDVRLNAGAHGTYRVGVQYGQTVLAEQPLEVGRPWGLTLLALAVLAGAGAALYWSGRALYARARPRLRRASTPVVRPDSRLARFGHRLDAWAEPADDVNRPARQPTSVKQRGPRLPWLTPDAPGTAARRPVFGGRKQRKGAGSSGSPDSTAPDAADEDGLRGENGEVPGRDLTADGTSPSPPASR